MAHYLNNKDFLKEIIKSQDSGKITEECGKTILLLARKYIKHPWFNGYTYKDDMVSMAVLNMTKAVMKFDRERTNAHAYFSTISRHSFTLIKRQERKHRDIRDLLLVEHDMEPSHTFTEAQGKLEKEQRAKEVADKLAEEKAESEVFKY